MSTTVNVLCYKSKTLANGEHPLMICVSKDGKKKYSSLGISVHPIHWDFVKNKPKRSCPNKVQIEKIIRERTEEYTEQILEYKAENKDYSLLTLVEKVSTPNTSTTVGAVFQEYIEKLKMEKRLGYAHSVRQVYNSLLKYNKHLEIYFSDVDVEWLKNYETWLRKENIAENTIGIRFRTLRAIYNLAIEKTIAKPEYYPFKTYKVSKLHQATAKRAITKEAIVAIMNYPIDPKYKYKRLAVDLFAFSYLMGGINFVDMAHLTRDNIIDSRLVYNRQKTGKLIKLPLQEKAVAIINFYYDEQRKYLFPILFDSHKTDIQKRYRIHDVIADVNKHLKQIGKELHLPIELTTYVARHSFATVLKRAGVNTSLICESLGHSSEKVTQIYLDSFENSQIDEALKNLL